ncbi:MAG: hypothetical protein V4454_00935 [Pseudomonadota bacterium]
MLEQDALQKNIPVMTYSRKWAKWALGIVAAVVLLLTAVAAAFRLIPSDQELATTAAARLGAALGAEVRIGAVHWRLLPSPAVVVQDVTIVRPQPITFRAVTLDPDIWALARKHIRFDRVTLDGAVVPQISLRGLDSAATDGKGAGAQGSDWAVDEVPLAHFVFTNVTWITRRGIPVIYDGEAEFDANWRPRTASLRRPGFTPLTELLLTRQGTEDRWAVAIKLGGGTANGEASLQTLANGRLKLAGKLKPRDVEAAAALEAFNRRPAISGRMNGDTTLSAEGDTVVALAQSLNTKTPFVMGPGKLLRFDLDKAIRTVGKDHAGQTPLDSVTGLLETQNTPDGMVSYFRGIRAKSGSLSATGDAKLFNRQVDAEFAVDLVDGIVGVPLKVTGPTSDVRVSVPGGAVAGAVVGTAILPGIGTAIGARIGATLGKLFGPAPGASAPKTGATNARQAP